MSNHQEAAVELLRQVLMDGTQGCADELCQCSTARAQRFLAALDAGHEQTYCGLGVKTDPSVPPGLFELRPSTVAPRRVEILTNDDGEWLHFNGGDGYRAVLRMSCGPIARRAIRNAVAAIDEAEREATREARLLGKLELMRAALVRLADRHHRTVVGSKKHDPENREWQECDCGSCEVAQIALGATLPTNGEGR